MAGLVDGAKEMFDNIPEGGACIVTLTNDMAKWLSRRLPDWRGAELASMCRVVGIHQLRSVSKIEGEMRPIIIHHVFDERASADVRDAVHRVAHACNVMHA